MIGHGPPHRQGAVDGLEDLQRARIVHFGAFVVKKVAGMGNDNGQRLGRADTQRHAGADVVQYGEGRTQAQAGGRRGLAQ